MNNNKDISKWVALDNNNNIIFELIGNNEHNIKKFIDDVNGYKETLLIKCIQKYEDTAIY